MGKRIVAVMRKEFRHIFRDPRSLLIIIAMPIMMVLLYGYALNMDIRHIPLAVVDHDRTPESRRLVEQFEASESFDVTYRLDSTGTVERLFEEQAVRAVLVIPPDFASMRETEPSTPVQLIVDGSDPTYGNVIVNYATAIALSASTVSIAGRQGMPFDIRDRFLYNPELESSHFLAPGLVAVIMMMVCALLTSITIAREKETGTMDVMLVSPVHPFEIIVGKVVPYILLALTDAVFILAFAKLTFDIPLRGDLVLLLGLSILYIYCALGIGLFISSVAPTQQVAMMAALMATIMPSVILSGFIFPIFSMPRVIQAVTYLIPARYYMEIIRGILLKATPFPLLIHQTVALAVWGTVFLLAATIRFQVRRTE